MAKNLDRAKQLGLYEDGINSDSNQFRETIDHASIKEISDTILRALPLLQDDMALIVASIFYEIMPPFKEAILANTTS